MCRVFILSFPPFYTIKDQVSTMFMLFQEIMNAFCPKKKKLRFFNTLQFKTFSSLVTQVTWPVTSNVDLRKHL